MQTDGPASNAAASVDRAGTDALIREAIDALPERHRLPLVLHYFGGLSLDSIARELGVTRTAVGTRLHRARKLLGKRLGERGITFDAGELSGWVALIVPAAVLARLEHATSAAAANVGATGVHAGVTSATTSPVAIASFAGRVGHLIAIAARGRPVVAAGAAAALLCGSATSVAWMVSPRVRGALDIVRWVHSLADWSVPTFRLDDVRLPRLSRSEPNGFTLLAPCMSPPIPFGGGSFADARDRFDASIVSERAGPARLEVAEDQSFQSTDHAAAANIAATAVTAATRSLRDDGVTPLRPSVAVSAIARLSHSSLSAHANAESSEIDVGGRDQPTMNLAGDETFERLDLGREADDDGVATQTAGTVVASHLIVGDAGRGRYELLGGGLNVGSLVIGAQPRSNGTVLVGGGDLNISHPAPILVGAQGNGRLLIGTANTPGKVTTATGADVSLIVRETASANGLLRGWGEIGTRGTLVNNGRVVADGFDHVRTLDLSQASNVINTIDNPPDGTNGWYARRGGRVELPAINVASGTHLYTWGESADDPSIDLVNSLRLTAHDQPVNTSLRVALRTVALADPLDIPLPLDTGVFGIWQMSGSDFHPSSLNITIRYDHVAADSLFPGEMATRLIG